MTQNFKNTAVLFLVTTTVFINFANFSPANFNSSVFAKSSKTKIKREAQSRTKETKTKNSSGKDAKGKNATEANSQESDGDWRKLSKKAAELIFYHKFVEGDAMLLRILPIARKEDPNGLELGVCLARYGYGLMGEKKYEQSLPILAEAFKVTLKTPQSKRQQRALFQILKAMATDYYELNQFDKSETFARQTLAYRIAFPHTSSLQYFKNTYEILRLSLEHQKKSDEAMIITEIESTLS